MSLVLTKHIKSRKVSFNNIGKRKKDEFKFQQYTFPTDTFFVQKRVMAIPLIALELEYIEK